MKTLTVAAMAALMLPAAAHAQDATERLTTHLYGGTAAQGIDPAIALCEQNQPDACFAAGLFELVVTVEEAGQAFYHHGATTPGTPVAAMLFGMGMDTSSAPANPNPEPLTYDGLRAILEDVVTGLDVARERFEWGGQSGDYVIVLDPLKVRLDLNGDGKAEEGETLATLMEPAMAASDFPLDGPPVTGKTKGPQQPPDTTIGFDRADSIWFAGYTQVSAAPVDLMLAHDFSGFFNAYLHRVFPEAGLPMQDFSRGGTLFMDANSDAEIADIIAAIHTLDFPVTDSARLAGVLGRLQMITSLSRQNWEAILAETDDTRELVPSPRQTSLVPDTPVTQEVVDAWMATLDTVDQVLAGELLVPHWRFKQGFDLKAYFETATETDLVMLLTGSAALPYLKEGPVADANSFAEANRTFGTDWVGFAFWFN